MAVYPANVKTFTTKVDFTDDVLAAHINDLQSEVVALESVLGVNAMSSYSSVSDRISASETAIAATNTRNSGVDAAWTSWTPTWTGSATNPSLGNGTLTGTYKQIGKLVIARFQLNCGSTTSFGTGNWRFSYPVAPNSAEVLNAIGFFNIKDASAGVTYICSAFAASSGYMTLNLGQTMWIDGGFDTMTFSSDTVKSKSFSFNKTFTRTPLIIVESNDNQAWTAWYDPATLTNTGFTGYLTKLDQTSYSGSRGLRWKAIGPIEQTVDWGTPMTWVNGDSVGGTLVYEAA